MKRFTTIALIALLALAALVVPATALVETVEVRSEVFDSTNLSTLVSDEGNIVFDETNFAGFWYDIDANKSSEVLTILNSSLISGDSIEEKGLWYNSTIQQTEYEGTFAGEEDVAAPKNETFPVIGLFAEKYVPLDDEDASELVKLLIDNDDKYTLRTGSALELANGYELTAKQIDVEGDKVWMELSKDGEFVEDEVVDVTAGEATWDYDTDVGDQTDVIVFRVKITDVFQGQVDSLAVVEGLWLIDYEDVLEIESSDEFGELEVSAAAGTKISMFNSNTISFGKDKTVTLAEGLKLKTADSDDGELRYYPFVERTIGEGMVVDDSGVGEEVTEEMPAEEEVAEEEVPAEEEVVAEEEMPAEEEEAEPAEETAEEESPGFEAVFAVAGLLAVAYLVRRN